jgi:hypothetical protein
MASDAVGAWLAAAGRVPLLTAAEEIHLGAAGPNRGVNATGH